MGHNVGVAADRAVKNSERVKPVSQRTPEERLANIRNLLAAGLAVPPVEQKFLLAQYDSIQATLVQNTRVLELARATVELAHEEIESLKAQIAQFRTVYEQENSSTTFKLERVPVNELILETSEGQLIRFEGEGGAVPAEPIA